MQRETETEKRQGNKDRERERQINYIITRPITLLRQISQASSKETKRDGERDRDRIKRERE